MKKELKENDDQIPFGGFLHRIDQFSYSMLKNKRE